MLNRLLLSGAKSQGECEVLRKLAHDLTRSDESAESFLQLNLWEVAQSWGFSWSYLVSKGIRRPQRSSRSPRRRRSQYLRLWPRLLKLASLHSNLVSETWMAIEAVESPCKHWNHQNDDGENGCEPESRSHDGFGKWTDVRSPEHVVVETVEYEIPQETSPYHDVIAYCPVRCVKCDLEKSFWGSMKVS